MNEKTIKIEINKLRNVEGFATIRSTKNDKSWLDSLRLDRISEAIKNQLLIAYNDFCESDKTKFEININY